MSADPTLAAIERGATAAAVIAAHRNAVIHHLSALMVIGGEAGMRASAAGAVEYVVTAHKKMRGRAA